MRQIKRIYCTISIAGLLCLGLIVATLASATDRNACSEDIAKFCKNVQTNRIATLACLEKHESDLSDACKAYEAKMEGRRGEMMEAARVMKRFSIDCKTDIMKFCTDVNPEQQGDVKCVNEHVNDLSPSCREWVKAANAETKKME